MYIYIFFYISTIVIFMEEYVPRSLYVGGEELASMTPGQHTPSPHLLYAIVVLYLVAKYQPTTFVRSAYDDN